MARFDTGLTDAERERYACLAEEAGEIVQAVGKIQRHGVDSQYPNGETNRQALGREIGELIFLVKRMIENGDVTNEDISRGDAAKLERFRKFTHFQDDSEDWRPTGHEAR